MSASPRPPWSPYGLEAHRVALLRRRNRLLLAGILLGLLVVLGALVTSIRTDDRINAFGSDLDTVEVPITERPRAKPTTLSISPGRTTVMDQGIQEERPPAPVANTSNAPTDPGINWLGLLTNLAPPLGAAAYAWRSGRKKLSEPLRQVNLGVYKGALPLELISASHRAQIFTAEQARHSLFGKTAQDHLPAQPMVVARRSPVAAAAGTKATVVRRSA